MAESLIVFIFGPFGGWLALIISGFGINKNKHWLVLLGAILFVPFCFYMRSSPSFILKAMVFLPLLHIVSA